MLDVMLDLETFGKTNNAAIVQLGAVVFDRRTGEIKGQFISNISTESCLKIGLEMDSSTVEWWMGQSQEARESILKEPRNDIVKVLEGLNDFIDNSFDHTVPVGGSLKKNWRNDIQIWSHATFDFVILRNAYEKAGIESAFNFRGARDLRTLTDIGEVYYWLPEYDKTHPRVGTHHNALDDCIFQIGYAVEALNKIRDGLHPAV
jgi:hypothetical protein